VRARWLLALPAVAWAAVVGWGWSHRDPDLADPRAYRPWTSLDTYDDDWNVQTEPATQIWIDVDDLPDPVWQAFVAAEDPGLVVGEPHPTLRRGVSWTSGLVKPLVVHHRWRRDRAARLEEVVLAWRLSAELTPRDLIGLYLNVVFMGEDLRGVEAAARWYFGRPAELLDTAQAAMLAGMVASPTRYSPERSVDRARLRRALVLERMVELGWLTSDEAATHQAAAICVRSGDWPGAPLSVSVAAPRPAPP
jgi:penicillin-binding protein 1A